MTLSKIFALLITVLFWTSCTRFDEKHFMTSDDGPNDSIIVRLDLNADKTFDLSRTTKSKANEKSNTTIDDAGTISVPGTWRLTGDNVRLDFKESEEFVADAFFRSNPKTKDILQNYNQIVFSKKTDTLYIFGLPCIRQKPRTANSG